mgnify:CR=1 FL=1
MAETLAQLMERLPQTGEVVWIGLRPAKREPVVVVDRVLAEVGQGLKGDRFKSRRNGKRQVTLIQHEHLQAVASFLGRDVVGPELVRRNVVVRGINLLSLKNKRFWVGDALLEMTGLCHPCSRMEEIFGEGGYNAMRGHGGITARVIEGGEIALGAAVKKAAGIPL